MLNPDTVDQPKNFGSADAWAQNCKYITEVFVHWRYTSVLSLLNKTRRFFDRTLAPSDGAAASADGGLDEASAAAASAADDASAVALTEDPAERTLLSRYSARIDALDRALQQQTASLTAALDEATKLRRAAQEAAARADALELKVASHTPREAKEACARVAALELELSAQRARADKAEALGETLRTDLATQHEAAGVLEVKLAALVASTGEGLTEQLEVVGGELDKAHGERKRFLAINSALVQQVQQLREEAERHGAARVGADAAQRAAEVRAAEAVRDRNAANAEAKASAEALKALRKQMSATAVEASSSALEQALGMELKACQEQLSEVKEAGQRDREELKRVREKLKGFERIATQLNKFAQ